MISGAADVDPPAVATMAVVGSTTVYALSWLAWLLFPILAVVLVLATRVGVDSRRDRQQCIKARYGPLVQWSVLVTVVAVNLLTIAADIRARRRRAGTSLASRHALWLVLPVGCAALMLLLCGSLDHVQWVLLCLLSYPIAAVLARPDWPQVFRDTLLPRLSLDNDYVAGALAMLGTTVTSYVYLWQTTEVAEEKQAPGPQRGRSTEAVIATVFTVLIFWFTLVATGATLGMRRQHVNTAEEAARALAPIAGPYATVVFGIALLASALGDSRWLGRFGED
jgi:Mn2+/Fe2+ NRAMP family transporter